MFRYLRVGASPVDFNDKFNARTCTSTVNSEWFSVAEFDMIEVIVYAENISGTTPTLDIKLQTSPDGGTTAWDNYPVDENSNTQASFTQITTTDPTLDMKAWGAWLSGYDKTDGLDPRVRVVCTIGGTNPSYDITLILNGKKFRS